MAISLGIHPTFSDKPTSSNIIQHHPTSSNIMDVIIQHRWCHHSESYNSRGRDVVDLVTGQLFQTTGPGSHLVVWAPSSSLWFAMIFGTYIYIYTYSVYSNHIDSYRSNSQIDIVTICLLDIIYIYIWVTLYSLDEKQTLLDKHHNSDI